MLTVLDEILRDLDGGQALVVAPIRVAKQTWPTEITEWSHVSWIPHTLVRAEDQDPDVKAVFDDASTRFLNAANVLGVPPRDRQRASKLYAQAVREEYKQEKRRRLANTPSPLHIVGLPQIEWLVKHHGRNWPYKTVVVDESSAFKDHGTKRFEALNSVYKKVERMHILTASPAAESWLGIFSQVYLLDRGERLGRNITTYRDRYFQSNEYTRKYELLSGAQEKISEAIGDICLVMKADDYLSRDKPTEITRPITLADDTIALYDDFVQSFILKLGDVEIESVSSGVLINKLLQFTGGAVLDEDRNVHEIHDDKIEDLKELVEELDGKPLIVAYWYKSSLTRLRRAFPKATVMDKGAHCLPDWNAGKIPLLFLHPAGSAHGLNMQHGGSDLCFYDVPWSYELYSQTRGRIDRQGQKHPVRVWHQIVKRADDGVKRSRRQTEERMTADEIVMAALADKGEGQDALFRYIRAIRDRIKRQAVVLSRDSDNGDDL